MKIKKLLNQIYPPKKIIYFCVLMIGLSLVLGFIQIYNLKQGIDQKISSREKILKTTYTLQQLKERESYARCRSQRANGFPFCLDLPTEFDPLSDAKYYELKYIKNNSFLRLYLENEVVAVSWLAWGALSFIILVSLIKLLIILLKFLKPHLVSFISNLYGNYGQLPFFHKSILLLGIIFIIVLILK